MEASDERHSLGPVLELVLLNIFVSDMDNGIIFKAPSNSHHSSIP